MDQFWLLVEFTIGLLNLPIVVTMFTVLAFMTNLNGFPMLTFTSGTKDIFRLTLYDAHLFYGLLFTSLFRDIQLVSFTINTKSNKTVKFHKYPGENLKNYLKPSQNKDFGSKSRRSRGLSRIHTQVFRGLKTRLQRRGWAKRLF